MPERKGTYQSVGRVRVFRGNEKEVGEKLGGGD